MRWTVNSQDEKKCSSYIRVLGARFLSFDFLVLGVSLGFLVLLLVLSSHFVFSLYRSDIGLV